MIAEAVCIGMNVAKSALDVAASDSGGGTAVRPMTMKASVGPSSTPPVSHS